MLKRRTSLFAFCLFLRTFATRKLAKIGGYGVISVLANIRAMDTHRICDEYFKGNKDKEKSVILQALQELTNNFNMLTEYNTYYLEHKMSYKTLLVAMFCFNFFKDEKDKTRICEIIEKAASKLENSDNKKIANKTPRRSLMSEVEEIVKGVM